MNVVYAIYSFFAEHMAVLFSSSIIFIIYIAHIRLARNQAKSGTLHCPECGKLVGRISNGNKADSLFFVEDSFDEKDKDSDLSNIIDFYQKK